jgi:hypothetical protein
MLEYRCYFLGRNGSINARREFKAASDAEALMTARALYAEHAVGDGFELWENRRRVDHETNST